jgi:hypothetical protein
MNAAVMPPIRRMTRPTYIPCVAVFDRSRSA